jgi:hypothetical protein
MPLSTKTSVWLAVVAIVAPLFAAMTFHSLDKSWTLGKSGLWASLLFFAATPVVWGIALRARRTLPLAFLKFHAALISAYVLVNIAFAPDESGSAIFGFGFCLAILGADALIARIAWARMQESRRDIYHSIFIYLGLTASIFAGCFVGIQLWSPTVPPRIIAAAETTAGDRPYCIEVDGHPARNAGELTGLSMPLHVSFTLNFRALLVIDSSRPYFGEWKRPDRTYLNWSYRDWRFVPVSDYAREGLHLDYQVKCTALAHFARDWV